MSDIEEKKTSDVDNVLITKPKKKIKYVMTPARKLAFEKMIEAKKEKACIRLETTEMKKEAAKMACLEKKKMKQVEQKMKNVFFKEPEQVQ